MNRILLFAGLCMALTSARAATPKKQKVYSLVKQYQPLEWYQEQLALWEAETKQNPKSAEAWLNVYTATRMIKLTGGAKTQADMDAVVEQVKKNIPKTFEGNYIPYWNGGIGEKSTALLDAAYAIDPNRPETYDDYVTLYEMKRDKAKLKEFCERWYASNDISEGVYAWNYNMLMSCDENAILITHGDNDTYPALVLQNAKDIRKDVMVLNAHMLWQKAYCDAIFKELGIPAFTVAESDKGNMLVNIKDMCAHIQKYSTRPFYYAATVDPGYYANVEKDLYTTGLAFKYSPERFDNIALLRRNYERYFLKDYLSLNLQNNISQGVVDNMNSCYLVSFLTLYSHYSTTGETTQLEKLTSITTAIAQRSGHTKEVEDIMKNSK